MAQREREKDDKPYLTGKLLLSMPGMGDPRFQKAVILMCAHDENGAMGLVINHAMPGLDLSKLLSQLNIDLDQKTEEKSKNTLVMSGGPVETARGFLLHSTDFEQDDTVKIGNAFGVTGTIDALKSIATGDGPDKMLFMLGYAGWGENQLDKEIQDNAWLIADADPDIIFTATPDQKWDKAVKQIGIDPAMLSSTAGRA